MIGVITHLSWEIERGGEAHLAGIEELAKAPVGVLSCSETGVLTHGPKTSGVHRLIRAPGEGEFPRPAKVFLGGSVPVVGAEDRLHNAGSDTAPLVRAATRRT